MNTDCEYCHLDNGWVKPIEKNSHVYIYPGLFGRWRLIIRLKGDIRGYDINYCPMCGRRLNE